MSAAQCSSPTRCRGTSCSSWLSLPRRSSSPRGASPRDRVSDDMLFYKAWLESRVRFLAAAAVLSLYCLTFVERARLDFPPILEPTLTYTAHVWRGIYNGLVAVVFVVMAGLLGLGGLERERESGSCAFTLALPVT